MKKVEQCTVVVEGDRCRLAENNKGSIVTTLDLEAWHILQIWTSVKLHFHRTLNSFGKDRIN